MPSYLVLLLLFLPLPSVRPGASQHVLSKVRFKSDFASHAYLYTPYPLNSFQWFYKLAPKQNPNLVTY